MPKFKVAIIGCGNICRAAHLPAYQAASDIAEVKYFVDILPERAQAMRDAYGAGTALTDYHEILNDPELDAVSVCTPNYAHAPIAIDFLRAGKQVLCEKPAAMTADLAAQMKQAADETGNILNIGVCNRFNTAVCKIEEMIRQGALGDVYHVYCSFRAHRSIPGLGGPFTTKSLAGGGVLIDWGVHYLDLIFYCIQNPNIRTVSSAAYAKLGENMRDYVYTGMWAGPPKYDGVCDVEEFVTGMVRTAGPTITFNGAWAQNIGESATFVEFLGDKGGIKLIYGGDFTYYSTQNGMLTETKFAFPKENMYNAEVRDFLLTSAKRIKTRANIDNAIVTSRLMDLIYRSAEEQQEIRV